jgi:predicted nuclease with TOPRIM domain
MSEELLDRLTQLEAAVRRAGETLTRMREDNERLRREVKRLEDERRQVLTQVDAILKDLGKLDLAGG